MKGAVKMKKQSLKVVPTFLLCIALIIGIGVNTLAVDAVEGGYVGVDVGIQTVSNFISNFNYEQYYWAEDFMFRQSNNSYVDAMNFAFYCGHGNNWLISEQDGTIIDLSTAGNAGNSGWGDFRARYVAFYSCLVVPSPVEVGNNWFTPWQSVLTGVRQILGYRTDAAVASGPNIGSYFGAQIRAGGYIWQNWFNANDLYGDLSYMRASALFDSDAQYDTYNSTAIAAANSGSYTMIWQN
jgi:hypothetical protein